MAAAVKQHVLYACRITSAFDSCPNNTVDSFSVKANLDSPTHCLSKKNKKNSKIPLLCGFSFFVRLAARTEPEITGMKSELSFCFVLFFRGVPFPWNYFCNFPPNVLLEPWQVCLCVQRGKKKNWKDGGRDKWKGWRERGEEIGERAKQRGKRNKAWAERERSNRLFTSVG